MKGYWAQPSLSRDFTLLTGFILFLLALMITLVAYVTYAQYSERMVTELQEEANRIDRTLITEMENAEYLLSALGRQLIFSNHADLTEVARLLKAFDNKKHIYYMFAWVNPEQMIVVSSNMGVVEHPINVSDRDYVKKAFAEPWRMQIGRPIEGRLSGRWVIPVSMGLTDVTGKYIGTLMISLDIDSLGQQVHQLLHKHVAFTIFSKTLTALTQYGMEPTGADAAATQHLLAGVDFAHSPKATLTHPTLFDLSNQFLYYQTSAAYPYIILMRYDNHLPDTAIKSLLWSRLLMIVAFTVILLAVLWMLRARIVRPVEQLTESARRVAHGEGFTPLPKGGPVEIESLSEQIETVANYIAERRRIENELRNKTYMLKQSREQAELTNRSKSEFMAYICQELRNPINSIVGFAQVMKDQLYGPMENKKYRQYALDIYQSGNTLLSQLQDILTFSKAESDYIELHEKPVHLPTVINKSLRFVADKMQAERLHIKTKQPENLPRLVADEFRLQQILSNLLIYASRYALPGGTLHLETRWLNENKENSQLAFIIGTREDSIWMSAEVMQFVERSQFLSFRNQEMNKTTEVKESTDLALSLAKLLIYMHGGSLYHSPSADGNVRLIAFFGNERIRIMEGGE